MRKAFALLVSLFCLGSVAGGSQAPTEPGPPSARADVQQILDEAARA